MKLSRRFLTTFASAVISLATIIYVATQLDWAAAYDTFSQLHRGWLAVAWLLMMVNYWLRTIRFQMLLDLPEVPFREMLSVTCLHGMFNYFMPAKTGELSLLFLLKQRLGVSLGSSTATLVTSRFFDFATVALFLPLVLFIFWEQLSPAMIYASLIFCVVVYLAAGVAVWLLRQPMIPTPAPVYQPDDNLGQYVHKRLLKIWGAILEGVQIINQRGQYGRLWAITIAIWLCVYSYVYLTVVSMGYYLSYFQIVVISVIMIPMTLLPAQGVANLGTHEVGWVIAFRLFGYSHDEALTIAVGSHLIILFLMISVGLLGVLTSFIMLKNK